MMSQIFTWIKTVSTVLIVLSLFRNLLPGKKYEQYINAFLGMLIVYVLFEPWSNPGTLRDVLVDGLFTPSGVNTEAYSQDELEAFTYHITAAEYERLLRLQIADEAQTAGLDIADIEVKIEDEQNNTYGVVKQIRLVCGPDSCDESAVNAFAARLSGLLGIEENNIIIE